ncbi:abhydrolase domain-containing protein 11-like protein [Sarcoptes scabiei]|uniref:Abhydrolase domain-containing protein 11-like protein n=1 Tax=Sarcoptes scabiei TaxID=52283 RepID=A0A131ZVN3_SARSC|nr:abhydrolase domain-containing protein 11-like protein [Sarcoptes scabiei]
MICQPEMIEKLILVDIGPLSSLPRIEFLTENFFHLLDSCLKDLPPNINLSDARIQVKKILNEKIKNTLIADFLVLNLYQNQNERSICWRFNLDAIEKFIAKGSIKNMDIKKPFSGQSMIIYGENSPYVRPEQFDQIRAVMPSVKFVGIPETGHYLHVEKPVQFIQKLLFK